MRHHVAGRICEANYNDAPIERLVSGHNLLLTHVLMGLQGLAYELLQASTMTTSHRTNHN